MSSPKDKRSKTIQGFKHGPDRLYGLNDRRESVQDDLEQTVKGDPYEHSDVTIDRINNRLGLSMPLRTFDISAEPGSEHPTDKAFHAFLRSKEDPDRGKTFAGRSKDDRIRRASKLGVDFSQKEQGTVHFLLGGLQQTMEDVVHKRNYNKDGHKDFTASELRYIYRNKDRLKDTVKFYDKDLQPTVAPWDTNPELWAKYKPGTHQPHSWPKIDKDKSPRSGASSPGLGLGGGLDLSALALRLSALEQHSPGSPNVSPRSDSVQSGSPRQNLSSPSSSPPTRHLPPISDSKHPAWNSSTRIDHPLSASATRITTHQPSSSGQVTGKVGSQHWPSPGNNGSQ